MKRDIEDQAADWVARRNGGLTVDEQAALSAWLAQDPRHREALETMERMWGQLTAPRRQGRADVVYREVERLGRRQARHRGRLIAWCSLGAAAAVLLLLGSVGNLGSVFSENAPAASLAVSLPPLRTLADGSKVALRADAAIEVDFSTGTRRVRLTRGEALFTVARDPSRPFIVQAGAVEVRAVGTEFSVAQSAGATTVYVTEGRIAVSAEAPAPVAGPSDGTAPSGSASSASVRSAVSPVLYAAAGERVVIPAPGSANAAPVVVRVSGSELASALAWRGQRLEFSEVPLGEAVRMVNRGRTVPIVLADPALGQRTLTGVWWADDGDGFVRLLEQGFDLKAERDGKVVRLHPRQ